MELEPEGLRVGEGPADRAGGTFLRVQHDWERLEPDRHKQRELQPAAVDLARASRRSSASVKAVKSGNARNLRQNGLKHTRISANALEYLKHAKKRGGENKPIRVGMSETFEIKEQTTSKDGATGGAFDYSSGPSGTVKIFEEPRERPLLLARGGTLRPG